MALMSIMGRRKVKSKHYAAWRRVAHYLITGLPWREACNAPPDHKDRPLHREFRQNLKAHWPDNHTMWRKATPGTQTDLHALSGMHNDLEHRAIQARNTADDYI
jgi:hypothetical protein